MIELESQEQQKGNSLCGTGGPNIIGNTQDTLALETNEHYEDLPTAMQKQSQDEIQILDNPVYVGSSNSEKTGNTSKRT